METSAETTKTNAQLCSQANIWLGRYAELSAKLEEQRAARKPLEEEQQKLRSKLQTWAEDPANQVVFGDSQSINLVNGTIGFKSGPEKVVMITDNDLDDKQRTAAIVAALERFHADGVKKNYDEKQLLKAWPVLPKLRKMLEGIVSGVKRETSFVIALKK
jgi:hypothetical protein